MSEAPPSVPLRELEVVTVAPPPRPLIESIVRTVSRRIAAPCRLQPQPLDFKLPSIPGRAQIDADRLLESVEALDPPPGRVLVALTGHDIGHPIFTHFFGRARHYGSAIVVALPRLAPSFYGLAVDDAVTVRRAVLEICHELGHIAGLGHCNDWACIMRFASAVEGIDNRGQTFCNACGKGLPPVFDRLRQA